MIISQIKCDKCGGILVNGTQRVPRIITVSDDTLHQSGPKVEHSHFCSIKCLGEMIAPAQPSGVRMPPVSAAVFGEANAKPVRKGGKIGNPN
jgi:hypothetical protein